MNFNNSNTGGTCLIGVDGGSYAGISTGATLLGSWSNHPLIFATNTAQRMRITATGNVGINTTSPTERLEVNGNIKSSGSLFINDISSIGALDNLELRSLKKVDIESAGEIELNSVAKIDVSTIDLGFSTVKVEFVNTTSFTVNTGSANISSVGKIFINLGTTNLAGATVTINSTSLTSNVAAITTFNSASFKVNSAEGVDISSATELSSFTNVGGSVAITSGLTTTITSGGATIINSGGATTVTSGGTIVLSSTEGTDINASTGVMALTALTGGITLTTGSGAINLATGLGLVNIATTGGAVNIGTGGGALTLNTGLGALLLNVGAGGIIGTVIAGAINLSTTLGNIGIGTALGDVTIGSNQGTAKLYAAGTGAPLNLESGSGNVIIKAPLGAIKGESPEGGYEFKGGNFVVSTTNNFTAFATANVNINTNSQGIYTGPGNIDISTANAYDGRITLTSKSDSTLTSSASLYFNFSTALIINSKLGLNLNAISTFYEWRYPSSSGSAGQVLTSQGGATAMTWTTPTTGTVTSVAMTVPSILSVSGSPITSSGTFAITTATTPTGSGAIVLANSPTLTGTTSFGKLSSIGQSNDIITVGGSDPAIYINSTLRAKGLRLAVANNNNGYVNGVSAGDCVIVSDNGAALVLSALSTGGGLGILPSNNTIIYKDLLLAGTTAIITVKNNASTAYNFQLPATAGSSGQVLTSQGGATAMTWTTPTTGTVTSVGMTVPSILSVTPASITSSGTFAITTTVAPTGTGAIVLATSPTLVTPNLGVASCTSLTSTSFVTALGALAETNTTPGAYIGMSGTSAKIELVSSTSSDVAFIDFATASPAVTHVGRIIYTHTTNVMEFLCTLNTVRLQINPGTTYTSITSGTVSLFRLAARSVIIMSNATNNITLDASGVTSDYSWRFPAAAGSAGHILTSQGGGSPMTWTSTTGSGSVVLDTYPTINSGLFISDTILGTGTTILNNATSNYIFQLPETAGSAGQVLTSEGGGSPMTWTTPTTGTVTSVAMTVPSILSVSGSPITSSGIFFFNPGTFAITTAAVPTGTGSIVLTNSPTIVNPSINSNMSLSGRLNMSAGSFTISVRPEAATTNYDFRLPATAGSSGQVLTSQGGATAMTWTTPTTGTVTSVAITVPSILSVSGSPITSSGTFAITTATTPTGSGAIVLATSPTLVTPILGAASCTSITSSTFVAAQGALAESNATPGAYLGMSGSNAKIELVSSANTQVGFIDFTTASPAVDHVGRILYNHSNNRMELICTLNTPVLQINPSTTFANVTSGTVSLFRLAARSVIIMSNATNNVTLEAAGVTSDYTWRFPATAGSAGQVLTSQGGGSPMTWTTSGAGGTVTSVAMTVPSILSVSGSPITSSGTLKLTQAHLQ
jgi:hypothetical protein